jgi:single-strand DNA-binding protein
LNRITIIGNITKDPDSRQTQSGITCTTFTVAVNRRNRSQNAAEGQPEADFFRVTAWRGLGDTCAKYLAKGRKVAVVGPVSLNTFTGIDGANHATLEVTADDVEFLSSRSDASSQAAAAPDAAPAGEKKAPSKYVEAEDEDLPFE